MVRKFSVGRNGVLLVASLSLSSTCATEKDLRDFIFVCDAGTRPHTIHVGVVAASVGMRSTTYGKLGLAASPQPIFARVVKEELLRMAWPLETR